MGKLDIDYFYSDGAKQPYEFTCYNGSYNNTSRVFNQLIAWTIMNASAKWDYYYLDKLCFMTPTKKYQNRKLNVETLDDAQLYNIIRSSNRDGPYEKALKISFENQSDAMLFKLKWK